MMGLWTSSTLLVRILSVWRAPFLHTVDLFTNSVSVSHFLAIKFVFFFKFCFIILLWLLVHRRFAGAESLCSTQQPHHSVTESSIQAAYLQLWFASGKESCALYCWFFRRQDHAWITRSHCVFSLWCEVVSSLGIRSQPSSTHYWGLQGQQLLNGRSFGPCQSRVGWWDRSSPFFFRFGSNWWLWSCAVSNCRQLKKPHLSPIQFGCQLQVWRRVRVPWD
jgi:hypothetical protein